MPVHSFLTALNKDNGFMQTITITFSYFLPEQHSHWQEPNLGSIKILDVLSLENQSLLSTLSVLEHIHLRRACWIYLEDTNLKIPHNIIPIK